MARMTIVEVSYTDSVSIVNDRVCWESLADSFKTCKAPLMPERFTSTKAALFIKSFQEPEQSQSLSQSELQAHV